MSLESLREQLSSDEFSASIDELYTSLPHTLSLKWQKGNANALALKKILAAVGSSITSLILNRGHLLDPPTTREDALVQADIDTLSEILTLTPGLIDLELGFAGYAPDDVWYTPCMQGEQHHIAEPTSDGETVLIFPTAFATSIARLKSFIGTGEIDFALPVILANLNGANLVELALGDTVIPSADEMNQLSFRISNLERLHLGGNADKDAAQRLIAANKRLARVHVPALNDDDT